MIDFSQLDPRALARGSVGGVPEAYLPMLQQVNYETGCPMSWMAAVCEAGGWNPTLQDMNWADLPNPTVRRIGLAGIWLRIPEILIDIVTRSIKTNPLNTDEAAAAGWCEGYANSWGDYTEISCWQTTFCGNNNSVPMGSHGYSRPLTTDQINQALDPLTSLRNAASLLMNKCVPMVRQTCGDDSGLIFIAWQLGCFWLPTVCTATTAQCPPEDVGKCWIPPGTPQWLLDNMDLTWSYQIQYAQIFGEKAIGNPLQVTITADNINIQPGDTVTFQAHTSGGQSPYSFTFNFGDGSPLNTQNAVAQHAYTVKGVYQAFVQVRDDLGMMVASAPISIGVGIAVNPPPSSGSGSNAGLLALLGLAGLAGVAGLAASKKKKPNPYKK